MNVLHTCLHAKATQKKNASQSEMFLHGFRFSQPFSRSQNFEQKFFFLMAKTTLFGIQIIPPDQPDLSQGLAIEKRYQNLEKSQTFGRS